MKIRIFYLLTYIIGFKEIHRKNEQKLSKVNIIEKLSKFFTKTIDIKVLFSYNSRPQTETLNV
ncbi:MAG: hypothetical protein ABFQ64_03950, partial [Campylobacterota bacterium]